MCTIKVFVHLPYNIYQTKNIQNTLNSKIKSSNRFLAIKNFCMEIKIDYVLEGLFAKGSSCA